MITIILCTDKNEHFESTYPELKELLPLFGFGKNIISRMLREVPDGRFAWVVANKSDEHRWSEFLGSIMFTDKTHGMLDTALQSVSRFLDVLPDQELLIIYSNIFFGKYDKFLQWARFTTLDGLYVFSGLDDKMSSNRAGIFYFKSFHMFLQYGTEVNNSGLCLPDIFHCDNFDGGSYGVSENEIINLRTVENYQSYIKTTGELQND